MLVRRIAMLALLVPAGLVGAGFQDEDDDGTGSSVAERDNTRHVSGEAVLLMNFDEKNLAKYHRLDDEVKKELKRRIWTEVHRTVDLRNSNWTNILILTDRDGHKPEPAVLREMEALLRRDFRGRSDDTTFSLMKEGGADPDVMCAMYSRHFMPPPLPSQIELIEAAGLADTELHVDLAAGATEVEFLPFVFWGDCRHCYPINIKVGDGPLEKWVISIPGDRFNGVQAEMILSLEWKAPFVVWEKVAREDDSDDDSDDDADDDGDGDD